MYAHSMLANMSAISRSFSSCSSLLDDVNDAAFWDEEAFG
jgi:hypothetical protein